MHEHELVRCGAAFNFGDQNWNRPPLCVKSSRESHAGIAALGSVDELLTFLLVDRENRNRWLPIHRVKIGRAPDRCADAFVNPLARTDKDRRNRPASTDISDLA